MRPACASLDADALRHNLREVRSRSRSRVMAIIKANGYGHGLVWVAHNLNEADAFGVASLEEGLELRAAGIRQDICLLEGFFEAKEIPLILRERLTPVIHEAHQVRALQRFRGEGSCDVWIKIDTGMHRLGFLPHEVAGVVADLRALAAIRRIGFLSHLASAEDLSSSATLGQLAVFDGLASHGFQRSLANSAGLIQWPNTHGDWVRPGLMLYGVSPIPGAIGPSLNLKPVMTLRSQLISVRRRQKGDPIGYGGAYRCPEDMPVGIVGLGYGDGYPRELSADVSVLIQGLRAPLVGRVSMDMLNVDLRPVPQAAVGDEVILWGQNLPVEDIAQAAGTIPYTLLCGLTQRLPRRELS
ncbi:MAG: alanine racemase [Acidiferrobacter sp.]